MVSGKSEIIKSDRDIFKRFKNREGFQIYFQFDLLRVLSFPFSVKTLSIDFTSKILAA